ncbi:septal ring lytic transglycosylase RlpA family protein [Granulosicoccaceae sp. 1_MG-2023]|nr:septal ring lytic transglycosylase RlpA family protein [Granulosicoccaceae sp. 1_MG-2023]
MPAAAYVRAAVAVVLAAGLSACAGQRATSPAPAPQNDAIPVPATALFEYKDGPGHLHLAMSAEEPQALALPRSRYGNPQTYEVMGRSYKTLDSAEGYDEIGVASWYGKKFHGRLTSSREVFDMYELTAAHRSLPLPTFVEVTNLENGRTLTVKVNDRGPFHDDRLIDLSYAAAVRLGVHDKGTARVRVRALPTAPAGPKSNMAQVMTDAASSATEAAPVQAAGGGDATWLQLGAFSDPINAEKLQARISSAVPGAQVQVLPEPARGIFKVRMGPLYDEALLDDVMQDLSAAGIARVQKIRVSGGS